MIKGPMIIVITRTERGRRIRTVKLAMLIAAGVLVFGFALWR